ncbi:hypothetical protein TWF594_000190 [Orbilia oligospora]|uniref:Dephospho-CoA kinase n=1 Tax=Orbilia oligospora TaxID=2813651 RepID=A0A7C8JMG8_ORBOL|nr:hypothetical protein TWF703_007492 [Orbilia oligospora]KAF3153153.1 hypothetical protein TWF594_000190 [Orbilia oligospora]
MLLIGLTGGIATGKSTVSNIFSSEPHSLPVIDADSLAHSVILPGTPAYRKILKNFLSTTPGLLHDPETDPNPSPLGPSINRKVLGRRVFGTSEANKRDIKILNGIVHPAVRWAIFRGIVLDVYCGVSLLVGLEPELQLERLLKRDAFLTRDDGEKRIASQMPLDKKIGFADVVIWNNDSEEELKKEIGLFVGRYKRRRPWIWTFIMQTFWPATGVVIAWRLLGNFLKRRRLDAKAAKQQ